MYATERRKLIERLIVDDGRVSASSTSPAASTSPPRPSAATSTTLRPRGSTAPRARRGGGARSREHRRAVHRAAAAASGRSARRPSAGAPSTRSGRLPRLGLLRRRLDDRRRGRPARAAPRRPARSRSSRTRSRWPTALAAVPDIVLTVLGGQVRGLTAAAVGADTVRAIEALRPDVAFVGTNGVSADFGLSTPDPAEAAVKRAIVRAARRVVVVADARQVRRRVARAASPRSTTSTCW